ncbi:LysR family transcriptional regulator [Coraliomargarita algicola]|uniref:LysR family transcriptional regulator n=1 Tax=Coraliomargarita algicola TaxID=3092156 RepID=A0ABZ0RKQ9_9BACT|nr:LysR family transcriptional regulator [Coraliomargarita sp. J2-16]WPJ95590.1 LysR family transcriptional regulator [Coraliomargarita sp. J2-16]
MELRHLEYFVSVVRLGSFTAAAKALGTTQPTVSKALSILEHECGARLLDRLSEGVKVTDLGEVVLRRATAMLAEREYLQAEIAAHKGLVTGHLRLGLPALGSSVLFAPLVAAYRQRYPGIEIDLHEQGSRRLEEMVRSGQIEMGATLAPVPSDFEWQAVVDEPMLALLPRGHPLAGRRAVKFDELVSSPFITFEEGFVLNVILAKACRARNVTLNVAARGAHADFIIALVAAGLGVSLLPRVEVESRGQLSVFTALIDEPDLRWRLGLMWRRSLPLSPAASRWLDLVNESPLARL